MRARYVEGKVWFEFEDGPALVTIQEVLGLWMEMPVEMLRAISAAYPKAPRLDSGAALRAYRDDPLNDCDVWGKPPRRWATITRLPRPRRKHRKGLPMARVVGF